MSTNDLHDLELLLKSQHPILIIETTEEKRVQQIFTNFSVKQLKPLFRWSTALGMERVEYDGSTDVPASDQEPEKVLRNILATKNAGIYLLFDFHPYLDQPNLVRLMKEISLLHYEVPHIIVLVSHSLDVPEELRAFATRFELSLPDEDALTKLVQQEAQKWTAANKGVRVKASREALSQLVSNLKGLTYTDAKRLAHGAIFDDGAIDESDIPKVSSAKYQLLDQSGALSFEYDTAKFGQVGGLSKLTRWLEIRKRSFLEADNTTDTPKGLLLVGVQGCGKSLAAKAVAGTWGVPLLRLDFGTLFNKFFGETEKNLRDALKTAEVMAPCVLWVDEIEKAIAQGDYDSGTSRRMLGTLLTWMAESPAAVFIVATANDITDLPPELIRKGRLDEIFWVDLPSAEVRQIIFSIHLAKRDYEPEDFDLITLANASDGFSGAEIEQAIVGSVYFAKEQRQQLATNHIVEELSHTKPLSVVMGEKIARMRAWAAERCVNADG